MGVLSLRARLVLALAYVLVLAIGSMLVPLVRSVRDRVNAEVETQALSQAEVVAATYSGGAAADELVAQGDRQGHGERDDRQQQHVGQRQQQAAAQGYG